MTEVRIRNVDEWVVESLRLRARAKGNTLENEIRDVLTCEARRPKLALAEELQQMRSQLREKYGMFSDSTVLIREDRDARG